VQTQTTSLLRLLLHNCYSFTANKLKVRNCCVVRGYFIYPALTKSYFRQTFPSVICINQHCLFHYVLWSLAWFWWLCWHVRN